jgi:peptide deformylase
MIRKIIQVGDPLLNQISKPLKLADISSRETQELIRDLLDTLDSDPESSAGLSAVQIGEPKRVYIIRRIDIEAEGKPLWQEVINPELTIASKHKKVDWEGCLSIGVGDKRLFAPVARYSKVKLKYYDRNGLKHQLQANGYLAHIIQHEQDHLDGKLFLRYVENPENIWLGGELEKYITQHGDYPPITKD